MRKLIPTISLIVLIAAAAVAQPTMPLDQVRKGMKGYGITVFEGTKLEKFDVEIIGVLRNIGPDQNIILARVDSPEVRRSGVIAGMSGSPIYIDGKLIGALAYGWQFSKEPIAGVTPIDEMLKLASAGTTSGVVPAATPRATAVEFLQSIASGKPEAVFQKMASGFGAKQLATLTGAKPIAIPLSLSSFAPETVQRFGPYLDQMGFVAVPSGTTSTSSDVKPSKKGFEPGDPIGAVLLNGDFNVAATGTVTHIDGNRVYAFGHPFLDIGNVSFPMAESEIVTVMPSLASSFKVANTGAIIGKLEQDRSSGIMGVIGQEADTIPVTLTVDGSGPARTYHVNVVRHTQLSPLILAMAADTVVANAQRGAGERTVMLDSEIDLDGMPPIKLREGWAGVQARSAIPAYLAVVSGYLMSNEFREARINGITLHLHHDDQLRTAHLMDASVVPPENGRISPGDTVRVRATLKPFRGESFVETFEFKVPVNQTPGSAYLLIGSGTALNLVDFLLVPPDPQNLEQALTVLKRLRPSTDLAVGLYSSGQGTVTAGVFLPALPPTMTAVVSGDTSNAAQSPVKFYAAEQQAHPVGYIVDGALKIDLDIKPQI